MADYKKSLSKLPKCENLDELGQFFSELEQLKNLFGQLIKDPQNQSDMYGFLAPKKEEALVDKIDQMALVNNLVKVMYRDIQKNATKDNVQEVYSRLFNIHQSLNLINKAIKEKFGNNEEPGDRYNEKTALIDTTLADRLLENKDPIATLFFQTATRCKLATIKSALKLDEDDMVMKGCKDAHYLLFGANTSLSLSIPEEEGQILMGNCNDQV